MAKVIPTGIRSPYLQIACGAVTVTLSELLLKAGAEATKESAGIFGVAALASVWTWLGIGAYIFSFVAWINALRYLPVALAYSLINITHVLVPMAAWAVRGEVVSGMRWAGISLVLVGATLVAIGRTKPADPAPTALDAGAAP
jgi:undecaprenyl phosphate-alpha-L-ara4N flippase subunit ArnF